MKRLFTFLLGVAFGIFLTFLYEVFGKPVMPTPQEIARAILDEPIFDFPTLPKEPRLPDNYKLFDRLPLEDTQPIRVDDEVEAWQLDQWAKESE